MVVYFPLSLPTCCTVYSSSKKCSTSSPPAHRRLPSTLPRTNSLLLAQTPLTLPRLTTAHHQATTSIGLVLAFFPAPMSAAASPEGDLKKIDLEFRLFRLEIRLFRFEFDLEFRLFRFC
jgi:hypothetical protein